MTRNVVGGFVTALLVGVWIAGCNDSSSGSGGGAPLATAPPLDWPAETGPLLTKASTDPVGDQTNDHPGARPPVLVPYAPADVTGIAFGVDGSYLYLRVDFAAAIPTGPVAIAAQPGLAAQTVSSQSLSLVMDADNDTQTGGGASPWLEGVDLFFAISVKYGGQTLVYVNYDFLDGDLHKNQRQLSGVVGAGGPGYDYIIVRYDVSQLPPGFFPRGSQVRVGSWIEAESELYHEMAADTILINEPWTIPAGP